MGGSVMFRSPTRLTCVARLAPEHSALQVGGKQGPDDYPVRPKLTDLHSVAGSRESRVFPESYVVSKVRPCLRGGLTGTKDDEANNPHCPRPFRSSDHPPTHRRGCLHPWDEDHAP